MIPSFAYPGGKAKLRKRILAMLPPEGQRYVEPFAGRGNVFFAVATLLKYEEFWLNDIQTWPFLAGLRGSWLYAVPNWRDPETFDRMKARSETRHGIRHPATFLEPYLAFSGGTYQKAGRRAREGNGVRREGFERSVRMACEIIRRNKTKLTRLDYRQVLTECDRNERMPVNS